jgi:hypothetical protein
MLERIVITACLVAVTAASADEPNAEARHLFLSARQAYEAGNLDLAAETFAAAYRLEPRPGLLWNLGQTYRRQYLQRHGVESLRQAVDCYRRYLADSPNGENREAATRLLAELSAQLPPESTSAASSPEEPRATVPAAKEARGATAPARTAAPSGGATPLLLRATPPLRPAPPWYRRAWVWGAVAGVVAVGVGVGVGLGVGLSNPQHIDPSFGAVRF